VTWPTPDELDAIYAVGGRSSADSVSQSAGKSAILSPKTDPLFAEATMEMTDAATGARQTVEQRAALESQQREGLLARIEGRLLSLQEQLNALAHTARHEQGRVDALEQKVKALTAPVIEHVAAPPATAHTPRAGRQ
jgi:uncharacterized membrane protein